MLRYPTGKSFDRLVDLLYLTGKSFYQRVPLWYPTGKSFDRLVDLLYLTGKSFTNGYLLVPDWKIFRPTGRSRRNPLKTIDRGPRRQRSRPVRSSGCRHGGDYQITVIINRETSLASLLNNCRMPVH